VSQRHNITHRALSASQTTAKTKSRHTWPLKSSFNNYALPHVVPSAPRASTTAAPQPIQLIRPIQSTTFNTHLTAERRTLQHVAREVGHDERHGGQRQVDWAEAAPVRPAAAEGLPVRVLRQVGERSQCDCEADAVREGLRPRRRSDPEESRQQERPASASHCAQASAVPSARCSGSG